MSAFKRLVTENPMLVEISRHRRRFLESGRGKGVNTMVLVLAMICYLALLMVVFNYTGDIPPDSLVYLQTGVFALISPAILYGSIAGERDRRSWDLLLVAPITRRQIVFGKFIAALVGLGIGWALFLFPTFITAITYKTYSRPIHPIFMQLFFQELLSISFGIFACALTLFFSARAKRAFSALGSSLGALFILLVVVPMFAPVLGAIDPWYSQAVNYLHPMVAIAESFAVRYEQDFYRPDFYFGLPHVIVYLLASFFLIEYAARTLTHADGDRRSWAGGGNA